jgi:vancomycin resistance protein VanJ
MAVWGLQSGLGDRWWIGTLLLFGPRWIWGTPLLFLVPVAVRLRPSMFAVLAGTAILIAGPVMGICIPWRLFTARRPQVQRLRIVSFNIQQGSIDPVAFRRFIEDVRPELVLFQEWGETRRRKIFVDPGWHFRSKDGLAIASRHPIRSVEPLSRAALGWHGEAQRYNLLTPGGTVCVYNVHLETPREGLEALLKRGSAGIPALQDNISLRRNVSATVRRFIDQADSRPLIAGDFNLPAESAIFGRYWSLYKDAFSVAGFGFGYTKYTRLIGIRIDHILVGRDWSVRRCFVGPDLGSDHRPLIADVTLPLAGNN